MKPYRVGRINKDFFIVDSNLLILGNKKKKIGINSKKKFVLLKYGGVDSSINELIACFLGNTLGLNMQEVDLAYDDKEICTMSILLSNYKEVVHTDMGLFFSNKEIYTISSIKSICDKLNPNMFNNYLEMILFDYLIGNETRTLSNFGISYNRGKYIFSPLYANNTSFKKNICHIYMEDKKRKYSNIELIKYLYHNYPDIVNNFIRVLKKIDNKCYQAVNRYIPSELLCISNYKEKITYFIKNKNNLINIIKKGDKKCIGII